MRNRILSALALLLLALTAAAQTPVPGAPALNARSFILQDFQSGTILAEADPDLRVEPASITKLMTSYVVFSELQKGTVALDDLVYVSEKAWKTPGSRMFIEVNSQVSVENLLKGMIIQSGNDASVALAEHVAGSEETFASLMNQYAQQLGMVNTSYRNATGLPADDHYTTARDVALLGKALVGEFPELYRWYSEKEFTYNDISQHNRNQLLWRDPAVDGMKTGHTEAAGYCLVSSAKRGNMRLISVVMGASSEKQRADDSQKLLNYGFRFFETHQLYTGGEMLEEARIWKGEVETLPMGITDDLFVTIPRGRYAALDASIDIPSVLTAPVGAQQTVGTLNVKLDEQVVASRPLVALAEAPEGGFWRRFSDSVSLWFAEF
ncbi:MAG: D-alanyl-D-alanine carboxypeptidase family protein [Pseudomonadota bacterium]